MLEIKVTVACPDLTLAASAIAAAINHINPSTVAKPAIPSPQATSHKPVETPNPAPTTSAQAPSTPVPITPAIPSMAPTAPITQTTPAVPVTPAPAPMPAAVPTVPTTAPTYTLDQIAKAGAELAQAGKRPQIIALLQQYGLQTVQQIPADKLGAFATALRGLGAKL